MNKLLLSLLGIALSGLSATAQTMPPDTARTHRHTFGLTASPQLAHFFTANRSLPIGLFYQRQLTPTKALRLRLVGLFSYADSANFHDNVFDIGIANAYITGPSYRRWQVQAFAGYAWQRPLGRRVALDYGLEVGVGYQRQGISSAYRYPYQPGGYVIDYDERIIQDWQVQMRPFAGMSYRPTPRLRVFAETALPLSYTYQQGEHHARGTFTKPDEADRFLDERTRSSRIALTWRLIQLIGVAYSF